MEIVNEIPVGTQIIHKDTLARAVVSNAPQDTSADTVTCVIEDAPGTHLMKKSDFIIIGEDRCPHCYGTGRICVEMEKTTSGTTTEGE